MENWKNKFLKYKSKLEKLNINQKGGMDGNNSGYDEEAAKRAKEKFFTKALRFKADRMANDKLREFERFPSDVEDEMNRNISTYFQDKGLNEYYYTKFTETLIKYKACISGSSVLSAFSKSSKGQELSHLRWETEDIDIYVNYKNGEQLINEIKKHFSDSDFSVEINPPRIPDDYDSSFFIKNKIFWLVRIYVEKSSDIDKNIEFDIMFTQEEPAEVISNFDLTFCQILFNGKNIFATHINDIYNKAGSLNRDYIQTYLNGNEFIKNRILKYQRRGFQIKIICDNTNHNTYELIHKKKRKIINVEAWLVKKLIVYLKDIQVSFRWLYMVNTPTLDIPNYKIWGYKQNMNLLNILSNDWENKPDNIFTINNFKRALSVCLDDLEDEEFEFSGINPHVNKSEQIFKHFVYAYIGTGIISSILNADTVYHMQLLDEIETLLSLPKYSLRKLKRGLIRTPDKYLEQHAEYWRVWTTPKPLENYNDKAILSEWVQMNLEIRYNDFTDEGIDNDLLFGQGKNLFESIHVYNKIYLNLS